MNKVLLFQGLFSSLKVRVCPKLLFSLLDRLVIEEIAFGFLAIIGETHEDCDAFVSDQLLESMGETFREPGEIDEY